MVVLINRLCGALPDPLENVCLVLAVAVCSTPPVVPSVAEKKKVALVVEDNLLHYPHYSTRWYLSVKEKCLHHRSLLLVVLHHWDHIE